MNISIAGVDRAKTELGRGHIGQIVKGHVQKKNGFMRHIDMFKQQDNRTGTSILNNSVCYMDNTLKRISIDEIRQVKRHQSSLGET